MRKLMFTLQVWLCVWLLVTLLNYTINWAGLLLPLPAQTMIISTILVPTMIFIIIPYLKQRQHE